MATITITGAVAHQNGNPVPNILIVVSERQLRTRTKLAEGRTKEKGAFSLTLSNVADRTAYFVEVRDDQGKTLVSKGPFPVKTGNRKLDFVVEDDGFKGDPIFKTREPDLKKYVDDWRLGGTDQPVTADDARFVAEQTGQPAGEVWRWMKAHQLEAETGTGKGKVPAEALYGLLKQDFPGNLTALSATPTSLLNEAWKQAVAANEISGDAGALTLQWNEVLIDKSLSEIPTGSDASLGQVLALAGLSAAQQKKLLEVFSTHQGDDDAFWAQAKAAIPATDKVERARTATRLYAYTAGQLELLTALLQESFPAGVHPIAALAAKDAKDWENYITAASATKLAVPACIKGATAAERTAIYAAQLAEVAEKAFFTDAFFRRMVFKLSSTSGGFGKTRTDLLTFFGKNPGFNFETAAAAALTEGAGLNLSGISNPQNLLKELRSARRMRAFTEKTGVLQALRTDGLDSARAVSGLPRSEFSARYGAAFGSAEAAEAAHARAEARSMQASALWGALHPNLNLETAATGRSVAAAGAKAGLQARAAGDAEATLRNLFGSQEACDCEPCMSLYSPAAYLTDILHFLEVRSESAYVELLRRRPDLPGLLLNCENTGTPLPYVDLVIELLENLVAPPEIPAGQPPVVYQTAATAAELAANPEHSNPAAYEPLKTAVYPHNLPFHFPLEESRVYLSHLGLPRHRFIGHFFAGHEAGVLEDTVIAQEYLEISPQESNIIAGQTTGAGAGPDSGVWNFYGFDKPSGFQAISDPADSGATIAKGRWHDVLTGRVDVFLQQTGLRYTELLQLLSCDFVNPKTENPRNISIVAVAGADADTCRLDLLKLRGTDENGLIRAHRFLRLWRKLKWSMYDLDKTLKAFGTTGFNADDTPQNSTEYLTPGHIKRLAQVGQLRRRFGCATDEVLALWYNLGADQYPDFEAEHLAPIPSLYEKLFRNKAVLQPLNPDFKPDPAALSGSLDAQAAAIQAALQIGDADYKLLRGASAAVLNGNLNLQNLSALYRHAALARWMGLSVADLLTLIALSGTNPFKHPGETLVFLWKADFIQASGFSLEELDYLLCDRFTETSGLVPDPVSITVFLDEIKTPAETAENSVAQKFSEAFGLSPRAADLLLTKHLKSTANPAAAMVKDFLPPGTAAETGIMNYRKFGKAAGLVQKFRISDEELEQMLINRANTGCLDFNALPVSPQATADWAGFEALVNLIRARDLLFAGKGGLFEVIGNAMPGNTDKKKWVDNLIRLSDWDKAGVEGLIGKSDELSNAGILKTRFPADFCNGDLILRIKKALDALHVTGLGTDTAARVFSANVTADTAQKIKQAANAKYDETQWQKIAKPLRDELRERQRAALLGYVVNRPDPDKSQHWNSSDELYEHLLIDVEMKPMAMTSRLKQALCSVQLFIDRALMNLERDTEGAAVLLRPEQAEEWKTWRKIYRVWEANRKIFLYPENWIEPELRDDQTPFFREATAQLLQNELNEESVEDAFRAYLEKLDEVARLEIVGMVRQEEPEENGQPAVDILHVFGRTNTQPHRYFHRCYEKNEWSPWLKIEADIDSDHLVPVIFNRRLCLFWLFFIQEAFTESDETRMYWKIQAAWSEYRKDAWTGKRLSKHYLQTGDTNDKTILEKLRRGLFVRHYQEADRLFIHLSPAKGGTTEPYFRIKGNFRPVCEASFIFENTASEPAVQADRLPGRYQNTLLPPDGKSVFEDQLIRGTAGANKLTLVYETVDRHGIVRLGSIEPVFHRIAQPAHSLSIDAGATEPFERPFVYQDKRHSFFATPFLVELPTFKHLLPDTPDTFVLQRSTGQIWGQYIRPGAIAYKNDISELPPGGSGNPGDPPDTADVLGTAVDPNEVECPPDNDLQATTPDSFTLSMVRIHTPTSDPFRRVRRRYRLNTFYHPQVKKFVRELNKAGVPGVLRRSLQQAGDEIRFQESYLPTAAVTGEMPRGIVDFAYGSPYSQYNWELFFHLPIHIACRLSADQRFEEARRWFHFVFDPTTGEAGGKERFWQFLPFYNEAVASEKTLEELLDDQAQQVEKWSANPFQPHVIARMRITAYMKFTLMKYVDNLIAWGDQLFRRDTIESINEATNLYVLAAKILGPAPQRVPARALRADKTYNEIKGDLDPLSNPEVEIEGHLPPSGPAEGTPASGSSSSLGAMFYFNVPRNEYLLRYWETVADRLFKIRHSLNIEGVARSLPLFEPPIDPALLVRAAAAGVDMNSLLSDVSAGIPLYRFAFMLQKANELVNEVKGLGASLLSALEKRDAEALSLLRSGHEQQLLKAVLQVRERQVEEAKEMLAGTKKSLESAKERFQYYHSRKNLNEQESEYLKNTQYAKDYIYEQGEYSLAAAVLGLFPQIKIGLPSTAGTEFGGAQLSVVANAFGTLAGTEASASSSDASVSSTLGSFDRRMDDWKFQAEQAQKDIEQLERQVVASEIRLTLTERELSNHRLQMEQSAEADEFMRNKFTNRQLFDWMSGQLSTIYFQSYQLAYDLAKKAEKCFEFELQPENIPAAGYVKFGYWDSLKKGLLAGEKLQYDLRRLEMAHLEQNKREFELTKHISLAQFAPGKLMDLKNTGKCDLLTLDESLFNADFPNHRLRRIKSVSLSIPCIAGPYTSINATLRLVRSKKPGTQTDEILPQGKNAISTSSAQNDSGLFELNFRDERYLPFEGAGLEESEWSIEMPRDKNQFDFQTITDVIMHVRYTARENTQAKKKAAKPQAVAKTPEAGFLLVNLRQEFSTEWYRFLNTEGEQTLEVDLKHRLPFMFRDKKVKVSELAVFCLSANKSEKYRLIAEPLSAALLPLNRADSKTEVYHTASTELSPSKSLVPLKLKISKSNSQRIGPDELKEMFILLALTT